MEEGDFAETTAVPQGGPITPPTQQATELEPPILGAIGRLADRTTSAKDETAILAYVAAVGVRLPVSFRAVAHRHASTGSRMKLPEPPK